MVNGASPRSSDFGIFSVFVFVRVISWIVSEGLQKTIREITRTSTNDYQETNRDGLLTTDN